jgi:hypothetical protein
MVAMKTTPETCARKRIYQSDAAAKAAIERASRTNAPALAYYRCPVCRHFHLTSNRGR